MVDSGDGAPRRSSTSPAPCAPPSKTRRRRSSTPTSWPSCGNEELDRSWLECRRRKARHLPRPARRQGRGDQPAPACAPPPPWPSSGSAPRRALDTAEKLRRNADGVAQLFIDLFVKQVWQPFDRAGRPERDWPRCAKRSNGCGRSPPTPSWPSSRSRWPRRPRRRASAPCGSPPGRETLRQADASARASSGERRVVQLLAGRRVALVGEHGEVHQRGQQRLELVGLAS